MASEATLQRVTSLQFFMKEGNAVVDIQSLSGGLQNTNYKVVTESGDRYVVRVPASDAEDHGQNQRIIYDNAKAIAGSGLAPAPVSFDSESGIIITRFLDGTTLSVALLKEQMDVLLPRFVGAVKQLHSSGIEFVGETAAQDVISGYPIAGMTELLPNGVPPRALELQDLLCRCLGKFEPMVPAHNDLTPTNCIMTDSETFLIDWEWSGQFDAVHDLSKLVMLCELDDAGEDEVLRLYFGGAVTSLHRCRIKLWKLHTTSREALWCHAKSINPAVTDYDYTQEARSFAKKFADQLALPETLQLMVQLRAALNELE